LEAAHIEWEAAHIEREAAHVEGEAVHLEREAVHLEREAARTESEAAHVAGSRSNPRKPDSHGLNSCYDDETYEILLTMKSPGAKKRWIKPSIKDVMIFFECTCYAGSV
jgi:hypothetical protein